MKSITFEAPVLAAQPRLLDKIQARLPVSILEFSIVLAAFSLVWIGLARVAGGPLYSDELEYIRLGLSSTAATHVLNRYFHIFLQKLFLEATPTPLIGVQVYWGFLVSLSASLVYLTARILSRSTNFLHGLLGVGLFFSFRPLAEYSGITIVDITAMAVVSLITFLYVYALRFKDKGIWAVYAVGFLFFLAFKTKETTLITGLLLLGFGFDEDNQYSFRRLLQYVPRFALGFLGGILFFALLNALILKDPLFGLTPAHYVAFSSELRTTSGLNTEIEDWFTNYLLPSIPVLFLLFVVSGVKSREHFSGEIRLLWLVPLALILFLSVSMIRGDWGIRARHLFPILPLLSLLAPQFLHFPLTSAKKELRMLVISLAFSAAALLVSRFAIQHFIRWLEGDVTAFMVEVVTPVFLSILLGLIVMKDRYSARSAAVPLVCLSLLLYPSLSSNVKNLFIFSPVSLAYQERILPLAAFEQQIDFREDMKMVVSSSASASMRNPGTNPDIMLSLFNFHFKTNAQRQNFSFVDVNEDIDVDSFTEKNDYLLFTQIDWDLLNENGTLMDYLENFYEFYLDNNQAYYFLSRK